MIYRSRRKSIAFFIVLLMLSMLLVSCGQKPITTLKKPNSTGRYGADATKYNGKIYLAGGSTTTDYLALMEEYDPTKDQWTEKASMPTARSGLQVVEAEDCIYAIGGRNGSMVLTTVEKYVPSSNTWIKCSSMHTGRWYFMTAVIDGKIYAMGGVLGTGNQRQPLDSIEVYDPKSDKWAELGPIPVKISNASVAVLNNKIYIISGRFGVGEGSSTTNRVDVYDPAHGVWTKASPVNEARTASDTCVVNNKIYMIGGAGGGDIKDSIEIYDPQTDKWALVSGLRQPRTDLCCECVNDSIYIMSGFSKVDGSDMLTTVEQIPISLLEASKH